MEKKFRTLLIILAIALSGALFYAAFSIKDNLEITYTKNFLQTVGNADITINTNEDSPGEYVPDKLVQKVKSQTSYIIGSINKSLNYRRAYDMYDPLSAVGVNLEDYKKMNDLMLSGSQNLEPFTGNKVIISEKTAKYYNLKLGDQMSFMIDKRLRNYEVVGIAVAKGLFLDESYAKYVIMPYDKLKGYLGANYPNTISIKVKEGESVESMIESLQQLYPKYEVKQPFTQEDLDEKTNMLSMSLLFITVMVSFMSIFIIYSSFKVIMVQKLPCLGTFRSVGATQNKINKVMLLESSLYGILGGILASILGIFLSYLLSVITMPEALKAIGTKVEIKVSVIKVIAGFLMANMICFMSTVLPILQMSRKPIKEIVLNIKVEKGKHKKNKLIWGIIFLTAAAVLPKYMETSIFLAVLGLALFMPAISFGTMYIMPSAMRLITWLLGPIVKLLFGNEGRIALNNIKKDKGLLNSATLIMIGVSVLLMVNSLANNLTKELIVAIANIQNYDLELSFEKMDKETVAHLRSFPEVKGVLGYNGAYDVPVTEFSSNITTIDGIESMDFFNYMGINVLGDREQLVKQLQTGRNVIITKTLQKRNHLKIGDEIEIDFGKFKGEKRKYRIIGVADTVMQAGSYLMIGEKYLQMDMNNHYYDVIELHLTEEADIAAFKEKLQKEYKDKKLDISTGAEFRESMRSSMAEMTNLITGFALIAVVVGCVGIVNNFFMSFIERKHTIAILRSIGMNKSAVRKMLVVEGGMVGIVGAVVGVLGGSLYFNLSSLFMTIGNVDMSMKQYPESFVIYILGGLLVAVIASVSPMQNASKLNIIEEIKYE